MVKCISLYQLLCPVYQGCAQRSDVPCNTTLTCTLPSLPSLYFSTQSTVVVMKKRTEQRADTIFSTYYKGNIKAAHVLSL